MRIVPRNVDVDNTAVVPYLIYKYICICSSSINKWHDTRGNARINGCYEKKPFENCQRCFVNLSPPLAFMKRRMTLYRSLVLSVVLSAIVSDLSGDMSVLTINKHKLFACFVSVREIVRQPLLVCDQQQHRPADASRGLCLIDHGVYTMKS